MTQMSLDLVAPAPYTLPKELSLGSSTHHLPSRVSLISSCQKINKIVSSFDY